MCKTGGFQSSEMKMSSLVDETVRKRKAKRKGRICKQDDAECIRRQRSRSKGKEISSLEKSLCSEGEQPDQSCLEGEE